jgi:hypothetical protein
MMIVRNDYSAGVWSAGVWSAGVWVNGAGEMTQGVNFADVDQLLSYSNVVSFYD